MLTESTLLTYFDETEGWVRGRARSPYVYNSKKIPPGIGWEKKSIPLKAAINEEKGVYLRWFVCQHWPLQSHKIGQCINGPHLHLEIRIRTSAGGLSSTKASGSHHDFIVPCDLNDIINARGAPKNKVKITKAKLPEPFKFNQQKWIRNGLSWSWERMTMLAHCTLLGPVGITDNAKVQADIAQQPNEKIWWHFYCSSPMSATFDVITDGEIFYPLNRRSKRITTNLQPKKSVDLTKLSVGDLEMMLEAIETFAEEL